ncbi:MAG TPA: hypothetical protein VIF86_01470 [Methylobacter sp.]
MLEGNLAQGIRQPNGEPPLRGEHAFQDDTISINSGLTLCPSSSLFLEG